VEPPHLNFTHTFRSIPIIFAAVIIPLFVVLTVTFWILSQIASLGLATGFAANYITTLQGIISSFDILIMFTFSVMFAAVIIRSFRLKTHPVLGILGLFGLPIAVIVASYVANIAGIFTGFDFLGTALNQFQYTVLFLQNTGLVTAVTGVLVLLVMVGGGLIARQ